MHRAIIDSYAARKALFTKGLREGRLSFQEIDRAVPPGAMTAPERWLLYHSLRSAEVEIFDEDAARPAADASEAATP